jgi:hypothetical protein
MIADCIICIYTSTNEYVKYELSNRGIKNILVVDNIHDLLKIKFIDVLFICDDKSKNILRYIDNIIKKYNNIRIICVVGSNGNLLANKLIEHKCDCILRNTNKCALSIDIISDKIKDFIKIYNNNKKFNFLYNKRKTKECCFSHNKRKSDFIMVNDYV